MTTDHRFSSTVPATLQDVLQDSTPPTATGSPRLEFGAAGDTATELAEVLVRMRQALTALLRSPGVDQATARPLMLALANADHIAMQGRLLAKVASGAIRQNNTQTRMDRLLQEILAHQLKGRHQGRSVQSSLRPVNVLIDPDLAAALLGAVLDWGMGEGATLEVSLDIKEWPVQGQLRMRASGAGAGAPREHERLCWHLVTEICRTVGASVDRVQSSDQCLLSIEFARTVHELEGLSAMEVDVGAHSAVAGNTPALAGHRALIVTSDVRLREQIKRVCQGAGLSVDNVPSSQLAAQRCEQGMPDIIVVDERFNDERFEQLRLRLIQRQPNFPMVEITYSSDLPLSLEGWGTGGMTRVSRAHLAVELDQALALEMSKIL